MCELCRRHIIPRDLHTVQGVTVCRSARWCLITMLQDATPAQIQALHTNTLQTTLRGTQTIQEHVPCQTRTAVTSLSGVQPTTI